MINAIILCVITHPVVRRYLDLFSISEILLPTSIFHDGLQLLDELCKTLKQARLSMMLPETCT